MHILFRRSITSCLWRRSSSETSTGSRWRFQCDHYYRYIGLLCGWLCLSTNRHASARLETVAKLRHVGWNISLHCCKSFGKLSVMADLDTNMLQDMFIILTSSCARFMPSRRGYSRVSLGHENGRRGRRNEDENRLIDNLDEEWDD
jgi:hypothetical protein